MGSNCCRKLRNDGRDVIGLPEDEDIVVDLPEDHPHSPLQCTDAGELDFVDLRLDVFPVQCSEPPAPVA